MNASKENAEKAGTMLGNQNQNVMGEVVLTVADRNFMQEFVASCIKRLPTEAAISKDKGRKRSK